jgi:hypothetical protein
MLRKLLGIFIVGYGVTGKLLIIYHALVQYLRKKWEYNEAVYPPLTNFKKAYDLVRRFCKIN